MHDPFSRNNAQYPIPRMYSANNGNVYTVYEQVGTCMLTSDGYRGWRREVRVFAGEWGRGKGVHLETWVTRADCKGINTDTHTHNSNSTNDRPESRREVLKTTIMLSSGKANSKRKSNRNHFPAACVS